MITLKVPEMIDITGKELPEPKFQHYHTWTCGCMSRLEDDAFVVIPCNEDCHLAKVIFDQGERNVRI